MKRAVRLAARFSLLLLVLGLSACGASLASPTARTSVDLADLAWLTEGPWQTELDEDGCFSLETWQREDAARLVGRSIAVCSADDSIAHVTEEIVLEEREDGIFYVASPVDQERTEFRLTEADATHFVVENPSHDFPTRIAYRRIDEAHLEAVVSGPGRSFTLSMTARIPTEVLPPGSRRDP